MCMLFLLHRVHINYRTILIIGYCFCSPFSEWEYIFGMWKIHWVYMKCAYGDYIFLHWCKFKEDFPVNNRANRNFFRAHYLSHICKRVWKKYYNLIIEDSIPVLYRSKWESQKEDVTLYAFDKNSLTKRILWNRIDIPNEEIVAKRCSFLVVAYFTRSKEEPSRVGGAYLQKASDSKLYHDHPWR